MTKNPRILIALMVHSMHVYSLNCCYCFTKQTSGNQGASNPDHVKAQIEAPNHADGVRAPEHLQQPQEQPQEQPLLRPEIPSPLIIPASAKAEPAEPPKAPEQELKQEEATMGRVRPDPEEMPKDRVTAAILKEVSDLTKDNKFFIIGQCLEGGLPNPKYSGLTLQNKALLVLFEYKYVSEGTFDDLPLRENESYLVIITDGDDVKAMIKTESLSAQYVDLNGNPVDTMKESVAGLEKLWHQTRRIYDYLAAIPNLTSIHEYVERNLDCIWEVDSKNLNLRIQIFKGELSHAYSLKQSFTDKERHIFAVHSLSTIIYKALVMIEEGSCLPKFIDLDLREVETPEASVEALNRYKPSDEQTKPLLYLLGDGRYELRLIKPVDKLKLGIIKDLKNIAEDGSRNATENIELLSKYLKPEFNGRIFQVTIEDKGQSLFFRINTDGFPEFIDSDENVVQEKKAIESGTRLVNLGFGCYYGYFSLTEDNQYIKISKDKIQNPDLLESEHVAAFYDTDKLADFRQTPDDLLIKIDPDLMVVESLLSGTFTLRIGNPQDKKQVILCYIGSAETWDLRQI